MSHTTRLAGPSPSPNSTINLQNRCALSQVAFSFLFFFSFALSLTCTLYIRIQEGAKAKFAHLDGFWTCETLWFFQKGLIVGSVDLPTQTLTARKALWNVADGDNIGKRARNGLKCWRPKNLGDLPLSNNKSWIGPRISVALEMTHRGDPRLGQRESNAGKAWQVKIPDTVHSVCWS